jgi:hypothetical protein
MNKFGKSIILILLAALALSACGENAAIGTPTAAAIRTQAVGTFAAGLTQTQLALPTNTPTETPTLTPSATATSKTPLASATSAVPTTFCYGMVLVTDVTIPDGTPMTPGQAFTKTWRVQNTGTCNWDAGFKFVFTVGDSMGGKPFALTTSVAPAQTLDISIAMTAPTKAGDVTGHWRMSTAANALFGADVYVKITVTAAATGTVSPTASGATATATPTGSATP